VGKKAQENFGVGSTRKEMTNFYERKLGGKFSNIQEGEQKREKKIVKGFGEKIEKKRGGGKESGCWGRSLAQGTRKRKDISGSLASRGPSQLLSKGGGVFVVKFPLQGKKFLKKGVEEKGDQSEVMQKGKGTCGA